MVPRLNNTSSHMTQQETLQSLGQQLRHISQNNHALINTIESRMNDTVIHAYKYSVNYDLPNVPNHNDAQMPWTYKATPIRKPIRSLIDAWEYSGHVLHRTIFDGDIDYTLIKYNDIVRLNHDLAELGAKYVEYFADRQGSRVELQHIISNMHMIQEAISEVHDMTLDRDDSVGARIHENMRNVADALQNLSDCMPDLKVSVSGERFEGDIPSNDEDEEKDDGSEMMVFGSMMLNKRASLSGHSGVVMDMIEYEKGGTQHMASASRDKSIKLWDLNTNQHIKLLSGHTGIVTSLAKYQKDNITCMASASYDYTIKLWNLDTQELIITLTGHTDYVYSLATYEINGIKYLASCSADKTIKTWSLQDYTLVTTFHGHTSYVYAIKHYQHNDVHYLASGGDDNTIKIWNLHTNMLEKTLTGHSSCIWRLDTCVHDDMRYLISGDGRGNIRIWNILDYTLITTLIDHSSKISGLVTFRYNNEPCLASAHENGTMKIWNLNTFEVVKEINIGACIGSLTCMMIDNKPNLIVGKKDIEFWSE